MDTYITMTAYGVNAEDALTEAADKLSVLEQIWSVTDSGSDIYAINHGSGQPVSVSEETAKLRSFALQMAEDNTVQLDSDMMLDLGAVGKGYAGERRISGSSQIGRWLTELDLNFSNDN